MGAVRMQVGDIAVDFPEHDTVLEEGPDDVLEVDDSDDVRRIEKWSRS